MANCRFVSHDDADMAAYRKPDIHTLTIRGRPIHVIYLLDGMEILRRTEEFLSGTCPCFPELIGKISVYDLIAPKVPSKSNSAYVHLPGFKLVLLAFLRMTISSTRYMTRTEPPRIVVVSVACSPRAAMLAS